MRRSPGARVYFLTYVTQVAGLAIGVVLGVLSARALGPEGRGDFAVLLASVALVVQLANVGLSSSITYWVSRRPSRAGRAALAAWILGVSLLAALLVLKGALPGGFFLTGLEVLVVVWAPLQLVATLQNSILLASGRYTRFNLLVFAGRITSLVTAVLAVVLFAADTRTFAISQLLSDAIVVVAGARLILLGGRVPRRLPARWLRPVVRMALRAFPVLLLPFLLVRSDIFLMKFFRGAAETGVYSVAAQLIDVILLFPATFAAVLFPALHVAAEPRAELVRIARIVGGVLAPSCAIAALIAPAMIPLLFGRAYREAVLPFCLLLPGALLLGINSIVIQFFARAGYPAFLAAYWAIGLALNLSLCAWLIPASGGVGAAISSTAGYATVAILVIRRFRMQPEKTAA